MIANGGQRLFKNVFTRPFFPDYNKLFIRRRVCDRNNQNEGKKDNKKTCFDQVTALHDKDTHRVSHVIMDLDGVMLNGNYYNILAQEEYLMRWKKALKNHTKHKIMGRRNIDAGRIITEEYEMPFDGQVYAHGIWQAQRSLFHKAKMTRGVDDLVCYFMKINMPLCLVSSANTKGFKILMEQLHGFEVNFCHALNGDDVVHGKPHPEIFIKAARLFKDGPKDLKRYLVIDSSYSGALAAKSAGMQAIVVAEREMPQEMQREATVVLRDVRHFDPTEFHLPQK